MRDYKGMQRVSAALGMAVGLLLLGATPAPTAHAAVSVNVNIGAPPPPVFVFENEPEVILVPRTRVYYVAHSDFDLFRYGRYWYINRGGWWYRARSYSGPFVVLEYSKVPVEIVRVPAKYHRHPLGGPPGQMKKLRQAGYKDVDRKDWDAPKKGKKGGKGRGRD